MFSSIVHLAMLYPNAAPSNTSRYLSSKIEFIPIPTAGGSKLKDKLRHFSNLPKTLSVIDSQLKDADYFQFRAPTGIGVYVIPYLIIFKSDTKGWYKYAGNWKQNNAPLSYKFQKWLLKLQTKHVTINGQWDRQAKHCLSFQNPCLSKQELERGRTVRRGKTINDGFELCYVGRLEAEKGLDLLITALYSLPKAVKQQISKMHFIGTGELLEQYEQRCKALDINFEFYGVLPRENVHGLFERCQCILLPSKSEGFPKVITEAMNYGCIPLVSNVSAIGQYIIHDSNGYLIEPLSANTLKGLLTDFLLLNEAAYRGLMAQEAFFKRFSYAQYNQRIIKEVLGLSPSIYNISHKN